MLVCLEYIIKKKLVSQLRVVPGEVYFNFISQNNVSSYSCRCCRWVRWYAILCRALCSYAGSHIQQWTRHAEEHSKWFYITTYQTSRLLSHWYSVYWQCLLMWRTVVCEKVRGDKLNQTNNLRFSYWSGLHTFFNLVLVWPVSPCIGLKTVFLMWNCKLWITCSLLFTVMITVLLTLGKAPVTE